MRLIFADGQELNLDKNSLDIILKKIIFILISVIKENRRFSAGKFYAFRTALWRGKDKTLTYPADYAGKALKYRAF